VIETRGRKADGIALADSRQRHHDGPIPLGRANKGLPGSRPAAWRPVKGNAREADCRRRTGTLPHHGAEQSEPFGSCCRLVVRAASIARSRLVNAACASTAGIARGRTSGAIALASVISASATSGQASISTIDASSELGIGTGGRFDIASLTFLKATRASVAAFGWSPWSATDNACASRSCSTVVVATSRQRNVSVRAEVRTLATGSLGDGDVVALHADNATRVAPTRTRKGRFSTSRSSMVMMNRRKCRAAKPIKTPSCSQQGQHSRATLAIVAGFDPPDLAPTVRG
jgi:hypothetical protein